MIYEKFKIISEGYKNTTIDIIAERSTRGSTKVNLEVKGIYPVITDDLSCDRVYQLDHGVCKRQTKISRRSLKDEMCELLFFFFKDYLVCKSEYTKKGRKKPIKITINKLSFEEIPKRHRKLKNKIYDCDIKIGELKVDLEGSVAY